MWQKIIICVYLVVGWGVLAVDADAQQSYRDLTFPELTFTLPDIEEQTLDNGLRVFLVEDHV